MTTMGNKPGIRRRLYTAILKISTIRRRTWSTSLTCEIRYGSPLRLILNQLNKNSLNSFRL